MKLVRVAHSLQPLLLVRSHFCVRWEGEAAREHPRGCECLCFGDGEGDGGDEEADEAERRVGAVEDMAVEVVHPGSTGDEGRGGGIEGFEEGVAVPVPCRDDDAVDVRDDLSIDQVRAPRVGVEAVNGRLVDDSLVREAGMLRRAVDVTSDWDFGIVGCLRGNVDAAGAVAHYQQLLLAEDGGCAVVLAMEDHVRVARSEVLGGRR